MSCQPNKIPFKRVGIGMPVYNGEQYIEEALNTNLSQTFDDFILVISDNASTDKTEEICRQYANQDERIYYLRNDVNLGAAKNYACCFTPTPCEYFRWSNADDIIEPTLIEQCLNTLDENPDTVLAYGKTKIIDPHGEVTSLYDDNLDLREDSAADRFINAKKRIGLSNVLYGLMRREELSKTALLGNYIASDTNLIVELTLYGKFIELEDYLFSRRMHPQASSWDREDNEAQASFWDASEKKLLFQYTKATSEYFRAVARAPISQSEKRRIFLHLSKGLYWGKQKLLKEIKDYTIYNSLRLFKE